MNHKALLRGNTLLHKALLLHAFLAIGITCQIAELNSGIFEVEGPQYDLLKEALESIYIVDMDFKFQHRVHEYKLATSRCTEHVDVFFHVPSWIEGDSQYVQLQYDSAANENVNLETSAEVDGVKDSVILKEPVNSNSSGNEKEEVEEPSWHPISKEEPAIDRLKEIYLDKEEKVDHDHRTRWEVDIYVNGQKIDKGGFGCRKLRLQCGIENRFDIEVIITGVNGVRYRACYKWFLGVPLYGNTNSMVTLEVSKPNGNPENIRPQLSKAYREHVVTIDGTNDTIFGIYAECQSGLPTIGNACPGNSAVVTMNRGTMKIELSIKCGDLEGESGARLLEATEYTLRFERLTTEAIPTPKRVLSLFEGVTCVDIPQGDQVSSKITCSRGYRRYSPLIIETDPDYRYFLSSRHAIDGYIEDGSSCDEGYIQLSNGVLTPVLDLTEDVTIYVTKGKEVKEFTIGFTHGEKAREAYRNILSVLIWSAYLVTFATTLVPVVVTAHTSLVFDHIPTISEPMMYLSQVICARAEGNELNLCSQFQMLPNINKENVDAIPRLMKFYGYGAVLIVMTSILVASKRKSEQQRPDEAELRKYLPLRELIGIFAFPWMFLNLMSVLKPIFGVYRGPKLELAFIKVENVDYATPVSIVDWPQRLLLYSKLPMAVVGLTLLEKTFSMLLREVRTIWAHMKGGSLVWVIDGGNNLATQMIYSFYDEQEPEAVDSVIDALNSDSDKGYWTYRKCNILSTEYINTLTSDLFPLLQRKYAVLVAHVKEVDLSGRDDAYSNEKELMDTINYEKLDDQCSSLEFELPEVINVITSDHDMKRPTARLRISRKTDRSSGVDSTEQMNLLKPIYREFDADMYLPLQVDEMDGRIPKFGSSIIAKIEARFLTYFLTREIIRSIYMLKHYEDFNRLMRKRIFIQATARQLFTDSGCNDSAPNRYIRSPLFKSAYAIMKSFHGVCAAVEIMIPGKHSKWIRYVQTIVYAAMMLLVIAERPYNRVMDNVFSAFCMGIGLYYMVHNNPTCGNTWSCAVLSCSIVAIIVYSVTATLLLLVDIIAAFHRSVEKPNEMFNTRIVVKDQYGEVVDVIYGHCHETVQKVSVKFEDEQVILQEAHEGDKLPIISVDMEHIDDGSCYLPYISICYVSNINDVFVVNRSQADRHFLRHCFYSRFSRNTSKLLARKITQYVEERPHHSCFSFEIPI